MVPKRRIPRILDDSGGLGRWALPAGNRQAESAADMGYLTLRAGRRASMEARQVSIESRACSPVRPDAAWSGRRPERRPSALDSTIDDVGGQPLQHLRTSAERRQAIAGAALQVARAGLGGFETEDAGVSGLGPHRIGTDGLAEIFGAALDVENFVLDL